MPPTIPSLDQLKGRGVSVLLDFDGTLVDIADRPDEIQPRPGLPASLEAVSRALNGCLAVISGRSLEDLQKYLGSAVPMIGSHGAEFSFGAPRRRTAPTTPNNLHRELEAIGERYAQTIVELKPFGGAIHFRSNPEAERAIAEEMERLALQRGLRLQEGKMVVEVLPQETGKGRAIEELMALPPYAGTVPVFIGDDLTDESAFASARQLGGFGVLVGQQRPTEALYHLPSVSKVHEWIGI